MVFKLPRPEKELVRDLKRIIHPNTDIVLNWLLEKSLEVGALKDLTGIPKRDYDRTIRIISLRDQLRPHNLTLPTDVKAAVSASVFARIKRLRIYRAVYYQRYPIGADTDGDHDERKKEKAWNNMEKQRRLLRGFLDVWQDFGSAQQESGTIASDVETTVARESVSTDGDGTMPENDGTLPSLR
ncbi:MAG: hypothetical protein Q9226_001642 [Calogaya cf. arnoldii]